MSNILLSKYSLPKSVLNCGTKIIRRTASSGQRELNRQSFLKPSNNTDGNLKQIQHHALQPKFEFNPILKENSKNSTTDILDYHLENDSIVLKFEDNTSGVAPHLWLRDNCQCSGCFSASAQGRVSLLQSISPDCKALEIEATKDEVKVSWTDGHISIFESDWLKRRTTPEGKENYRNNHRMQRKPWGRELVLENFEYSDLINNSDKLLRFLINIETNGISLVRRSPNDPDAGASLIDHIAFVKGCHYGRRSPVLVRANTNNLAFSAEKLGLHNDLTQYDHQAGIIFIQTVKQHKGTGGESVVSDGLFCSQILKKEHPDYYEILTKTPTYFWDKGTKTFEMEMDDFHKISKYPVIGLDINGELDTLRVNNQTRDSNMDLLPNQIQKFYKALMRFNDILYENSMSFKMNDGDILVLDNVRCLHGREGYEATSDRHLESAYLDFDEARCKRRRLQLEKSHITYS